MRPSVVADQQYRYHRACHSTPCGCARTCKHGRSTTTRVQAKALLTLPVVRMLLSHNTRVTIQLQVLPTEAQYGRMCLAESGDSKSLPANIWNMMFRCRCTATPAM